MATITALGVGSGLDLNGLLEQLESAEREKLAPIAAQRESYQSQISAYGTLKGAITQFQEAAAALNDRSVFEAARSDVSGEAVTAAARGDAPPGNYQIEVSQLARNYSIATEGVADRSQDLGGGTIGFELADGSAFQVEIDPASSSLEDIRDAINAARGGVLASIVNDGSGQPYRLALSSTTTGTEAAITQVDFGSLGSALALDGSTEVEARNAALTVNGINVTSQSNQVEGAIQGVTLALAQEGSASLRIEADTEAAREAVMGFVNAYNGLRSAIGELTAFNPETGEAGELLGNSTVRSVESRLRSALTGALPEGELRMLSDLGIRVQLNGSLQVDESRLDELVQNNRGALQDFFAGDSSKGGFAGLLGENLTQITRSGGLLDVATSGINSSLRSLDDREQRMETNIERTLSRYRRQFSQLDGMIATMNQTSEYLAQQFDMMNAQMNQGRRR